MAAASWCSKRGAVVLARRRQRHPRLDAVERAAARAHVGRAALGVHDAAAGHHPVDRAGADRLRRAEAVAVHDLAVEEVGHRRERDVRMRPHVDALAGRELARPHVIEEDERSDEAPLDGGQEAPHGEAAEIARPSVEDEEHGRAHAAPRELRTGGWMRDSSSSARVISCLARLAAADAARAPRRAGRSRPAAGASDRRSPRRRARRRRRTPCRRAAARTCRGRRCAPQPSSGMRVCHSPRMPPIGPGEADTR